MKLTIFLPARLLAAAGTLSLVLTACAGLFPTPAPTPTPAASETPTPSMIWFPPTNTPTSPPTVTFVPTPELHPGVVDLLFADSFDQPELWNLAASSLASATLPRNRLVLSITGQGPLSIVSLRSEPALGNFYAEVTANLVLCRGRDQYGMVFRAGPGDNYYRYTISCDGQVRLDRGRSGSVTPLLDWQPSADAPFGSPARLRLGVWAVGSEMRFFIDNRLQFSLRDPILQAGSFGFFAHASGATPVTVTYSDLEVYSVFYLSPTPTLTPSRTPTPSRTVSP